MSPVKSQRSDSSPATDNNLRLFDSPAKRASSPPTSPPDEDEQGAVAEESKKGSRRKSTTKDKGLKLNKKQAVETDKETARLLAGMRFRLVLLTLMLINLFVNHRASYRSTGTTTTPQVATRIV